MNAFRSFLRKGGLALYITSGAFVLTLVAFVLFVLSYTTTYYTFGDMNSVLIFVFYLLALAAELAVMYLLGDRFEGIGYTIFTDYDAGHGGEEACWYSIISSILMVLAIIATVVSGFFKLENVGKTE